MIRFALLSALSLATAAHAAAPGCPVPSDLPVPHPERPGPDQPSRIEPIGGYTLALIWTPEHCVHAVPGAESFECDARVTGSGFALHGLWPDGQGRSWPQWCTAAAILPRRTIAAHYCATPSAQLLQHEWAKHGTCMSASADGYFDQSNRLFYRVRYPDMKRLAHRQLTAGDFTQAFAAANPGMRPEMVRLNLDRDGWLREVWLCLDTRFRSKRCADRTAAGRPVQIRLPD